MATRKPKPKPKPKTMALERSLSDAVSAHLFKNRGDPMYAIRAQMFVLLKTMDAVQHGNVPLNMVHNVIRECFEHAGLEDEGCLLQPSRKRKRDF